MSRMGTLSCAVAFAAALSACRFGGGAFEGDLGGQPFDPIGTAFTYLDARDADLAARETPRVVVVSTWLIFDPNRDLNETEGALLEDMQHEAALRDNLALIFASPDVAGPGETLVSVREGGQQAEGEDLDARVYLQPEVLTRASTFDGFRPFASRRTVSTTVTALDLAAGAGFSGDVSLVLERAEGDPDDAREGQVSGDLFAPVVGERLAEHNLAVLGIDELLGL